MNRKGFTLLELLIVIAILAVLATVAVLVINPLEYLKQSRDSKRIADMVALNKAMGLAEFNSLNMGGASTTVFVSLTDSSATCANLALPALPTGYQYNCITATANLRKTDGTGWIPVNMGSITGGSPLSILPVDPTNDATKFYTYIPGGSFALSATLESDKYLKQSALADGGTNPAKIETGSDLKLLAKADGLVGYWPFDEGSGVVANDMSGGGKTGVWSGTGAHYVVGKVGQAGQFNGSNDEISMAGLPTASLNQITVIAWTKKQIGNLGTGVRSDSGYFLDFESGPSSLRFGVEGNWGMSSPGYTDDGQWHFIVGVYDGSSIKQIVDGNTLGSYAYSGPIVSSLGIRIGYAGLGTIYYNGGIDEVRIYNRALSIAEIKAIYDATK